MPVAADDDDARSLVLELASDIGFDAVSAGGLDNAALLEDLARLWGCWRSAVSVGASRSPCRGAPDGHDESGCTGRRTTPVSTLELFFDLVFVFAITQVTAYIAGEPTAGGLVRASCYWDSSTGRVAYSWLGTGVRVDRGRMTVSLLIAMAAMFCVAVLIPQWFVGGAWAVAAVAGLRRGPGGTHLYLLTGKNQPEMRRAAT